MKQLKEQTVYIPTKNKSEFGVVDPDFGSSYAYVKTCYCLSKDELIELLGNAWEQGWEFRENKDTFYGGQIDDSIPTKEQFINNLFI